MDNKCLKKATCLMLYLYKLLGLSLRLGMSRRPSSRL